MFGIKVRVNIGLRPVLATTSAIPPLQNLVRALKLAFDILHNRRKVTSSIRIHPLWRCELVCNTTTARLNCNCLAAGWRTWQRDWCRHQRRWGFGTWSTAAPRSWKGFRLSCQNTKSLGHCRQASAGAMSSAGKTAKAKATVTLLATLLSSKHHPRLVTMHPPSMTFLAGHVQQEQPRLPWGSHRPP